MTAALDRGQVVERVWVEQVMGLPVSLRVRRLFSDDGADATRNLDALVRNVFGYLRRVDEVFSVWRSDSELMRIRSGALDPRDAHPWLAEVRTLCEIATRSTGGLFVDQLTGPDGTSGWDPTGIVKGWAVERAVNHLRLAPELAFVIGAGGDILCDTGRGVMPRSPLWSPWTIGLENPDRPGRLWGTLPMLRGAAASSGTAARGAHIHDPRTGGPSRQRGSITVTGPNLAWADVWATVCFLDPTALSRCPSALANGYRIAHQHIDDVCSA